MFNTLVKLNEWETLIWSHLKLWPCNIRNCYPGSTAPAPPFSWGHLRASGTEWPKWATTAVPRGPGWGQKCLQPQQDPCPLHGGSMFRGTRVDGAPLTHSPVCDPMKKRCWEALSCNPTHVHLHLMSSMSPLHPAPPGKLRQVYPVSLQDNWKHLQSFQPAWNRQPEPFFFVGHVWTLASYGESQILNRKTTDSRLQS